MGVITTARVDANLGKLGVKLRHNVGIDFDTFVHARAIVVMSSTGFGNGYSHFGIP